MNKIKKYAILAAVVLFAAACSNDGDDGGRQPIPSKGVFVLNEGSFMAGNASLSLYDPEADQVANDVFKSNNGGAPLGDAAQSMTIYNGKGYVTLSNSGKVYVIDPETAVLKGKITGLDSPRYVYIVSSTKGYITSLNSNRITVFNPATDAVTGSIDLGDAGNCGEQMVGIGQYVYVNCWNMGNKILKIDPVTDAVADSLEVGAQPVSIASDADGNLWALCDGGWTEDWTAKLEEPSLVKVNVSTFTVAKKFTFNITDDVKRLTPNKAGNTMFYINNRSVWAMSVYNNVLPAVPYIDGGTRNLYSLGVDPNNDDIYAGDAIDWAQRGVVYRYSSSGVELFNFNVGVGPGCFCFNY